MKTKLFLSLIAISLGLNAMAADGDKYTMGNLTYTVTSEANHEVSVKASSDLISGDIEIPQYIQPDGGERYQVTSLDRYAFYYCFYVTSISIPESITSINEKAFEYCVTIKSFNIPSSVTSIGEYAFQFCESLSSITIPESVTSIGAWAFQECTSLTSIIIPNSVTSIGNYVFDGCKALNSINIPESITSISNGMFRDCKSLTSVNIPESVTSIGEYAFQSCESLTSINIPESVTSIGYGAFIECISLTSLIIPESVTSIGNGAFYFCTSLTSINIPESVTSIGNHMFDNCTSLTSINIPECLTSIGPSAFSDCSSLTSVNIPETVTSIGNWAFYNCNSLTTLNLPKNVNSLDYGTFQQCSNLETIYNFNPEPQYLDGSTAFSGVPSTATIYVPKQSMDRYLLAYLLAHGWEYFTDFRELDNVVIIPAATSLSLDQGETFQMWAKTHFAYDTETITAEKWESLNPAVATISTDGLVTACNKGETEVKYTVTTLTGTYSTACKITVTDQAGIGDIPADEPATVDAPAEYYTLQGVRVSADNLTPGIYIVRQGNASKKVLVK